MVTPGISHFRNTTDLQHYEVLLQMADVVVRHRALPELFHELALHLHKVIDFGIASFCLHAPAKNAMWLHVWEGGELVGAPVELPIEDTTAGWVWQNQKPLVFRDVQPETRFLTCLNLLKQRGVRSFCEIPLTTAQRRLGTLGLASLETDSFGEAEMHFLQRMADFVGLAVENALTRAALHEEKERLQILLQINAALVPNLDLQQSFPAISGYIRKVVPQDFACICLYDESTQSMRKYAIDSLSSPALFDPGEGYPVKGSTSGQALLEREVKVYDSGQLQEFHSTVMEQLLGHGVQCMCCLPLITRRGPVGTLSLASKEKNAFVPQDMGLLKQIAAQIAVALDNARAYQEIQELKDKLAEEKLYLQGEIRSELNFEEIIGESPELRRVLEQTKTVAPNNTTVLILGETGTGKELIARAIHRMSSHKDASFIKLNCAAIPTGLLESELFGHEKGAFTGAITQKIGRLELADKGTLFLDEIGEIPLELQPKLLRVLQDQEFERLGSNRTLRVHIRLIAATNRDLEKSIATHEFRRDLFYRLNVFPIRLPALRERKKDIPSLVRYFVQMYSRRLNKQIETVPVETMNALMAWHWPGNIRELENFMERSVILSPGTVLRAPLAELRQGSGEPLNGTLESMEREHIIQALRETGGVIAGFNGAAARLGLKRTTLQSRIARMGIAREEYEN